MFAKWFGKKNENAGVKIEISSSVVLTVVIMLSIGLFGDNPQNTTGNICAKNSSSNYFTITNKGLNHYITQSQSIINKYKRTIASSDNQLEELTKAVTVAKISGRLNPNDERFVYLAYGINVNTLTNVTYINNEKKLVFNEEEIYLKTDKNKLSAIKEVVTGKFS